MSDSAVQSFAIIPAAGIGQRMGGPKLMLPVGTSTLIGQVLAAFAASAVAQTIVIAHPHDAELIDFCRQAGARVVVPPTPPAEMRASVELGITWIEEHAAPTAVDCWLLAPADMPRLTARAVDALLAHHDPRNPRILVATHGGKRGHPVLFPWTLARQVKELPAGAGLNRLVAQQGCTEIEVADAGVLIDVDTPADYRRLGGQQTDSSSSL